MQQLKVLFASAILASVVGCGGSGSNPTGSAHLGGTEMQEYEAILPDGSPMEIEIVRNSDGIWMGEFAVAAETGEFAYQVGSFCGQINGDQVAASCTASDGTEFTLSGTATPTGFVLTRSDAPGATLTFTLVSPSPAYLASRGEASFQMDGGGTKGRATFNTNPYAVHGTITEYRGTWNSLPVTFWAYDSGHASVVTSVDALCLQTSSFSGYRLSDFPTKSVTSSAGYMTAYNTTLKTQIKFKTVVTASP